MHKRIEKVMVIIVVTFFFLIYRLFNLQITENENMLRKVSMQRMISVPINNIRGVIFDRNMIPLTGNNEKIVLSIIPQAVVDKEYVAKVIADNLNKNYDEILIKLNIGNTFEYIIDKSMTSIIQDKIVRGMLITTSDYRYGNKPIASHLIGYLNYDNQGQYGIEKGFDSYLKTPIMQNVGVISDAFRVPLFGYGYRAVNGQDGSNINNVKLTIDAHFQRIIEEAFDQNSYRGAAVLLDTKSGDVLAMVSRPNYDQNNIYQYFDSQNNELVNKALSPYSLGSIFKIVVANAALERGLVSKDTMFYCPGFIEVDGQLTRCSSFYSGGHGDISLEQAFSKSCNSVFIEIGLKLGYEDIINSANSFGFGNNLNLSRFGLYDDAGYAPTKEYTSRREIANISIGQGEILATPIQVANMINIIANDGIEKKINIVDSVIDQNDYEIENFREIDSNRVATRENVMIIKDMMRETADSGTGKNANVYEYGGVSGKSSSAETGRFNDEGQIIQAWFGGFFPNENPKYSLVILIEDGKSSSSTAVPLFGEISRKIMKISN